MKVSQITSPAGSSGAPRSSWKALASLLAKPGVIVLVAFVLRAMFLWRDYVSQPPLPRAEDFGFELGRVAKSIATGHGFSSPLDGDSGPTAWFTPVYPYFLAAVFKLFGIFSPLSNLVVRMANCAFSALTCVPVLAIARRCASEKLGAWSAWFWAVYPAAVLFPVRWFWDTSLSALLLALLFWATLALPEKSSTRNWVGYGALWAFAALTNPTVLPLLPFFAGWVILRLRERGAQWRRPVAAAALLFIAALVPWTARNYIVLHKWIPLRSNFGLELYLGNNPRVTDIWSPALHPNENAFEREKYGQQGEIAYMAEKQSLALAHMRAHPLETLKLCFYRFVYNWMGWPGPWLYLPLAVFSALSFLGLFVLVRERRPETSLFLASLFAYPLLFAVTHSSARYRHPIDPIMTVLAVVAVSTAVAALKFRTMRTRASESVRVTRSA